MAYKVLARKWRPQQFDDVVGQEHVTETLKNAIKSGRIAHAYLFVGPRGIGKTSIARILAKALNCVDGPTLTPCDKCDSCREIIESRSLDVLEIDGASNNSVDQIRDLRETVKYLPTLGAFKIYIIDEVHMLSPQAFNALLKTLEEPPGHVKFIFATTEPQKILATILSRCQRFDLRRIPTALIVDRLAKIAKVEHVEVDEEALLAVARGSEGALRDAESALDQLISFRGSKITEKDVLSVFGLISRRTLEELAEAMLNGNVPQMMNIVAQLDQAGKDMQHLVVNMLAHFRNLLVYAHARENVKELDIAQSQTAVLQAQVEMTSTERLLGIVEILIDTDTRLRYALSKRTLLETTFIRCARMAKAVSIDEILDQINTLKRTVEARQQPAAAAQNAISPNDTPEAPLGDGVKDEVALLKSRWHEIVDKVGKMAPLAKSALLDACPMSVNGNRVVIGFDPEFPEHLKRMSVKRNMMAMRNVLSSVLECDVNVECRVMSTTPVLPTDLQPEQGAKTSEQPPPKSKGVAKKAIKEWMQDDTVRKTLEMFGGEIIDVRE